MAGIPKRRVGERSQSYRLRVVDAELTRRKETEIAFLEKLMDDLRTAHHRTMGALKVEWLRYIRAKPGTKYDRTAKRKRK